MFFLCLQLIQELEFLLQDTPEEELTDAMVDHYKTVSSFILRIWSDNVVTSKYDVHHTIRCKTLWFETYDFFYVV